MSKFDKIIGYSAVRRNKQIADTLKNHEFCKAWCFFIEAFSCTVSGVGKY